MQSLKLWLKKSKLNTFYHFSETEKRPLGLFSFIIKIMDEITLPCIEKLVFESKEAAEGAAVYARHLHGTSLKVYKCRYCHLWHLASV